MKNLFTTLWTRLSCPTPNFWKNVQSFLVSVSAVSAIGLTQIDVLPAWSWLGEAFRLGMFAGLFGTFLAQLTCVTPPKENP